MITLNFKQQVADCFILVVDLGQSEEEINKALEYANSVEESVKDMLSGKLTPDELLESIEDYVPSMDSYVNEIEQNLYDLFVGCPSLLIL